MSSSTVSKRLCTVIPRQSRALSLYSVSTSLQHIDPAPQPYARPSPVATSKHHPTSSPSSPQSSQSQLHQSFTPSPPLQIALSPFSRPPQSSNSATQPYLFPTSSFPTNFPYFSPTTAFNPTCRRSRLTYRLEAGAYGIPKRRAHTCSIAPPLEKDLNLAVQVGEDAYFLRPDAMGVADGVGGWAKPQHAATPSNSALFSRSLMHFCSYELSLLSYPAPPQSASDPQPSSSHSAPDVHPIDILQRSYDRCLSAFQHEGFTGGSATALLAILRNEEIRIAHLGDCAVCLVRDGGIVYRSEEMQHAFNYPLQLGPSSPTLPAHARSISLPVQQNDILILSSDGMTDNLWDEDVLDEINKFTASSWLTGSCKKSLPSILSQALCSRAKRVSENDGRKAVDVPWQQPYDEVPFARRAHEEGIKFVGGKCDDISVLVAVISPHPDPQPPS